jgi:enoyl-CoA hydratase/carnithine racemase
MWSGRMVGAEEALAIGLVNRVAPAETLREDAMAWARQLASGPPLAVGRIKRALHESLDRDLETMLAIELENQLACFESQDVKRGLFAFSSKDTPRFEGN